MQLFIVVVVLLVCITIKFAGTSISTLTEHNTKTSISKEEPVIDIDTSTSSEKINSEINFYLSGTKREKRSSNACSNAEPLKRIDCGWPGISHKECTERGCCFDESLQEVPTCFINEKGGLSGGRHTQDAKCDFSSPHLRTECGYYGISSEECEARGCCADTRVEGNFARHCFTSFPKTSGKEASVSVNSCSNEEPSKRIDCGWPGISREECQVRLCCYDESIPGVHHCFINEKGGGHATKEKHKKCDFSRPHLRTDCGFRTITHLECEARDCCYDSRVTYGGHINHCFFSSPRPSEKCWDFTWRCNNGLCIPTQYRCNDRNDCGDSSDEHNCTAQTTTVQPTITTRTTTTTTQPTTNIVAIAPCSHDQWRCKNALCIHTRFVCDWDNDCGDGSDEQNCPKWSCPNNKWRCNNGWCIEANHRCDGHINHCGDGSDERHCPASV